MANERKTDRTATPPAEPKETPAAPAPRPGPARLTLTEPTRIEGELRAAGTILAEIRVVIGTAADVDKAIARGAARVAL